MPRLNWNKYLHRNKTGEADCQLVTALNAYYYLTGKLYCSQDSKEYERLRKLAGVVAGPAIHIEKIHKELGMITVNKYKSLYDITFESRKLTPCEIASQIKKHPSIDWSKCETSKQKRTVPLPLEAKIWEKHYGFHSVLIVDYEPKTTCFRVLNLRYATSLSGWIFEEDFNMLVRHAHNRPKDWAVRQLGLK